MSAAGEPGRLSDRASQLDRLDDNFALHVGWLPTGQPGMRVEDRPDLVLVDSGLPTDTFNVVCRARLEPSRAANRIAAVIEHFETHGRPFSWWHGPGDTPAELPTLLQQAGLSPSEHETAMVRDLATLLARPAPLADLEMKVVRDDADLDAFAQVLAANWDPPDSCIGRFYRATAGRLFRKDAPVVFAIGLLGSVPVATAEVCLSRDAAGLYSVATLAAYRGRGLGGAMTDYVLRQAEQRGAAVAVLQASSDGERVYRRLGFRSIGRFTEYQRAR